MRNGDKKRTIKQMELDRKFAIKRYLMGNTVRDIADMLNEEHPDYSVSYVTVYNDVKDVIAEAKKIREETGVSDLEELILKYEYLYTEATQQNFLDPNPGYINVASKQLEQIAKLKGLAIEKVEHTIKYDVEIN
jgi:hypothetical protein